MSNFSPNAPAARAILQQVAESAELKALLAQVTATLELLQSDEYETWDTPLGRAVEEVYGGLQSAMYAAARVAPLGKGTGK